MKKLTPIVGIFILGMIVAKAQDPAKVDPAHYKVIFNNPQVRILDVQLKPAEKTPMHSHPDLIAYSLTGRTVKSTLPDGKTKRESLPTGRRQPEIRQQVLSL